MKSDREGQVSYDTTYMWNVKKSYKWTYSHKRYKATDVENNRIIARVEKEEEYQYIDTTIFKADKKGPTI